jgi:hypothetical protein
LKSEKETLEELIKTKAGDIKKTLANDVQRYINDIIFMCV